MVLEVENGFTLLLNAFLGHRSAKDDPICQRDWILQPFAIRRAYL